MDAHITCQTILLPATPSEVIEEGILIFADELLMAVVMKAQQSTTAILRGIWVLKAGFGPCEGASGLDRLFHSSDEAQHWVREQVTRAHKARPLA